MLGNNIRVIFSNKNYRFKTSSDLFHVLLLNLFSVLSTSVCCLHVPIPSQDHSDEEQALPLVTRAISEPALFLVPLRPLPSQVCLVLAPSHQLSTSFRTATQVFHRVPSVLFHDASYLCSGLHLPGNSAQTGPLLLAFNLFLHFLPRAPADLSNIHQVLAEGCYSGMLCPY